jgi:hypothetical protein
MGSRIVNYALLFVAGLIVGTIGTMAQQSTVTILRTAVPWGATLALLTVVCLLVGLRLVNEGRWFAFVAAVGIVIPIGIFSLPSPGGSVVVPANALGYVWLYGVVIIATIVVVWPNGRRRQASVRNGIN